MHPKPLVSILLFTYHQERFIREAIESALLQSYDPLEVIVSDDCSKDRTYEVIEETIAGYKGPKRIIINRNPQNLGPAAHINKAFSLSHGDFIVMQAGDDVVVPDRVEKLVARWRDPIKPVDLVCSYFEEIDVDSRPTGFVKTNVAFVPDKSKDPADWSCGATGACAAYSRKIFEKYGPIDTRVLAEDWVFSFRAWLEAGIAVIEEPLVKHRTHDEALSQILRNVNKKKDPELRARTRRRGAENSLAIMEEWLRAWEIAHSDTTSAVVRRLRAAKEVRALQVRAYDVTRLEAFKIALQFWFRRGGFVGGAKIILRHVLRWR